MQLAARTAFGHNNDPLPPWQVIKTNPPRPAGTSKALKFLMLSDRGGSSSREPHRPKLVTQRGDPKRSSVLVLAPPKRGTREGP